VIESNQITYVYFCEQGEKLLIEWERVSGKNFELFIYHVLGRINFKNREWHGEGGSDKGRDIVGFTYEELPFNLGYERKWIFQCKKRKKMPIITEISNDIITASQHEPDIWVLVLSFTPTSNQMDNIRNIAKKNLANCKIAIMIKADIENICQTYPDLINVLYNGELELGGMDDNGNV
jgi:hypothetical protein